MPENFTSTPSPFFTNGANTSGTSTSINKEDASSISITIELSETLISSEKFLLPITPSKGATIVLFFNFAIISPDLTLVLYLISSRISYFSILYDCVLIGTAVPKVSMIFWNFLCSTVLTIIPGGGLLLNFF